MMNDSMFHVWSLPNWHHIALKTIFRIASNIFLDAPPNQAILLLKSSTILNIVKGTYNFEIYCKINTFSSLESH
jgi:hypothetical protein